MDEHVSQAPAARKDNAGMEATVTNVVRFGIVGLFAYWSLKLVAPFLVIVIWAAILAVALYPAYRALTVALGGSKRLAAIMLTALNIAIILGPLAALSLGFLEASERLARDLEAGTLHLPTPPASLREWPVFGEELHRAWSLATTNLTDTIDRFQPTLIKAGGAVLGKIASIGMGLLAFMASVIVSGFLLVPGPRLAENTDRFAYRIAGDRGVGFIRLATSTIRNVASGVIGVALLQTLLAGMVLYAFQVPATAILTFVILILCIIQLGPGLVLLPVVIWGWLSMPAGTALVLTLLLVPIAVIDNILKPILVSRGLSTPMLVILTGVIGGTIAYGLIGLFLGPIVLSVFYDLLVAWVRQADGPQPPADDPGASPGGPHAAP